MSTQSRYIGLMSGTSMDGIDAVLVVFENEKIHLEECINHSFSEELTQELAALCKKTDNELHRVLVADRLCAQAFADAVNQLLKKANRTSSDITAIGSHGQTLRHFPPSSICPSAEAYTLQVGDPNTIAAITGITTVSDFRRKDIALDGQGAPLVPAFHRAIFGSNTARAVINIGGIANITFLDPNGDILGFDCGPGNNLMDRWISHHLQKKYDADGQWANSGKTHSLLLDALLQHAYFSLPAPKSLDREDFNLAWLHQHIATLPQEISAQDVQATLLEFTAITISNAVKQLPAQLDDVFICGGGAYNKALMNVLQQHLQPTRVSSTNLLGVEPEWVEAMAFAWLAKQTIEKKSGNLPSVTGATREAILGGIYFP